MCELFRMTLIDFTTTDIPVIPVIPVFRVTRACDEDSFVCCSYDWFMYHNAQVKVDVDWHWRTVMISASITLENFSDNEKFDPETGLRLPRLFRKTHRCFSVDGRSATGTTVDGFYQREGYLPL